MAKPNFQFQKRQKELEKKKKNEEKLQRKKERAALEAGENSEESADGETTPE